MSATIDLTWVLAGGGSGTPLGHVLLRSGRRTLCGLQPWGIFQMGSGDFCAKCEGDLARIKSTVEGGEHT